MPYFIFFISVFFAKCAKFMIFCHSLFQRNSGEHKGRAGSIADMRRCTPVQENSGITKLVQ